MYEVRKAGQFGTECLPHLHGMHGFWRSPEGNGFPEAGRRKLQGIEAPYVPHKLVGVMAQNG